MDSWNNCFPYFSILIIVFNAKILTGAKVHKIWIRIDVIFSPLKIPYLCRQTKNHTI